MIVNCFYDEEEITPDIIYIPDKINNLDCIQQEFFKWIFDKEKSSAKFTRFMGMTGCEYGTENFVEWINMYLLGNSNEHAYVIEMNASEWSKDSMKIFF